MKFTLSWLKTYLETDASLTEITDKLTALGLEVEGVEDKAKDFDGFKVGYIKAAEKHPDADKLKVCTVDVGENAPLQIVCGAPNARQGIKVAFAPEGSYIPGIDVTLKKAVIRGVESNGMMCSERELCLSDEHNGIIELPDDAQVGAPIAPVLGLDDPIIEIAITPNRGDCAGVYGIARDLAAGGLGTLKTPTQPSIKETTKTDIKVDIQIPEACPVFMTRAIKGVKNGPSPKWLQDALRGIGLRPISKLVDITNYFCIGMNRPLHVFDADKVSGDLVVRATKKGESLDALNDKSYDLPDGLTAIADDNGVLGLGGVVGGEASGCTEETQNLLLEVAYFSQSTVATTGRSLQIDSDARYRFERGIDPEFMPLAVDLATQMILDLCGGEAGDVVTAGSIPDVKKTFEFDTTLTSKLGGVDLDTKTQKNILTKLGFTISKENGSVLSVTTPSWRHDIEGKADFVEEVLRINGYDNLPTHSVKENVSPSVGALTPVQKIISQSRHLLAGRGMNETVTWSFMDEKLATLFGINKDGQQQYLTLTNPISADLSTLRPSILPNLITAASRNEARGFGDACLFEIGPIFTSPQLVKGQTRLISGIRTGSHQNKHWAGGDRTVDVMDAKADVMAVLAVANPSLRPQITRNTPDYYHPGRSGAFALGKNTLAYFGEIHPGVLADMDIDFPVVAFEIFIDNVPLTKAKGSARPLVELSSFQPLTRDFAFIVSSDTAADDCIRAILGADKKLITDADIFDVYQGKGVEDGHKSLAVKVTLQPTDKTLTDEEIEAISQNIIKTVEQKTGGKLRG